MKKLMIAAAAAAMGGASFAATPAAQVYDVSLSIKTTAAATAKNINNKTNPFLTDTKEDVVYRKQASATWKGLIWGCDCEAIDGVWEVMKEYTIGTQDYKTIKGCVLWDTKTKKPVYFGNGFDLTDIKTISGVTGIGWEFINAIDKTGKKVEASWEMCQDGATCDEGTGEVTANDTLFDFVGAGFGTLQINDDPTVDCTSWIKSINGNFAGYMKAPYDSVSTDWSGCTFCGYDPGVTECAFASAWEYCPCYGKLDETKTAAYGTWKICYNSSLSKKLSTMVNPKKLDKTLIYSITQVYKFPTAVNTAIESIEYYFNNGEVTTCDELEDALAKATQALNVAKQGVTDAEADVAAVSREALTATRNVAKAQLQYVTEQYDIEALEAAYEKALYMETNLVANIAYTNTVTGDCFSENGIIGCDALESKINSFDNGTNACLEIVTSVPGLYGFRTCATWAEGRALVTERRTAAANAKAALENAELAIQTAKDDLAIAENNLANCDILTASAEEALEKAKTVQAAAQTAYDNAEQAYEDAGCND